MVQIRASTLLYTVTKSCALRTTLGGGRLAATWSTLSMSLATIAPLATRSILTVGCRTRDTGKQTSLTTVLANHRRAAR